MVLQHSRPICVFAVITNLTLIAASACAPRDGQRSSTDEELGVREARRRWNAALVARDSNALSQLVEDSAMHVSTRFVHSGRSAYLAQFLKAMTARQQFLLIYRPEQVIMCQRQNCQMATEYGVWIETWLEGGEPTEVSGTYFVIWRKHGEAWQIQREVFATTLCRGRRYCAS